MEKMHLKNLDSIRTIAFLSTFLAHSFNTNDKNVLNSDLYRLALKISHFVSFGVPVFFVLSGFLISYLIVKDIKNNRFSIGKFYLKRVLRIWPLYYLIIAFGFFLFPLIRTLILNEQYEENANFGMYLMFLSNFDQIRNKMLPMGVGLGPTWSVAVEEQFYLFWPLLFLVFLRSKKYKILIMIIFLVITISFLMSWQWSIDAKNSIFCMISLAIGGVFGVISNLNIMRINQKLGNSNGLVLFLLIFCVLFFANSHSFFREINYLLFSVSMSLLIIYQIHCKEKFDFKRIPALERLGKYTYGLYLYHSIFIFIAYSLLTKIGNIGSTSFGVVILIPILAMILTILAGYFSYHYYEKRFLNLKNKL